MGIGTGALVCLQPPLPLRSEQQLLHVVGRPAIEWLRISLECCRTRNECRGPRDFLAGAGCGGTAPSARRNLAEVGLPALLGLRLDAGDLDLELFRLGVLLRLLPTVGRATGHVVGDHVLGLADEAAFFLGQSRREVELRHGLTFALSHLC